MQKRRIRSGVFPTKNGFLARNADRVSVANRGQPVAASRYLLNGADLAEVEAEFTEARLDRSSRGFSVLSKCQL